VFGTAICLSTPVPSRITYSNTKNKRSRRLVRPEQYAILLQRPERVFEVLLPWTEPSPRIVAEVTVTHEVVEHTCTRVGKVPTGPVTIEGRGDGNRRLD
jgi:hypothetical protein